MAFQNTAFRVAIASPSDVPEERRILRQALHDWNAAHSMIRKIVLLPIGWDTDTFRLMGARAQEQINQQIILNADLLIAVFWTRLGSPTGRAASGTVEEIKEFRSADKPVMLYFSNAPVLETSVEPKQYKALRAFRKRCERSENGLVTTYESVVDLREKFSQQLALIVI